MFLVIKKTKLYSSFYAIEEADRNLSSPIQQKRLQSLLNSLEIIYDECRSIVLPNDFDLRDKDKPILQAAIYMQANYLITGDIKDFGQTIKGVTILPPAEYLKSSQFKMRVALKNAKTSETIN